MHSKDRILNIVKGKYGFKNKTEALIFVVSNYEKNLEPEIRPEYLKKLEKIREGKHYKFKDIEDLRKQIEG